MTGVAPSWSSPSRTWRSGAWSLRLRDDELADIAFEGRTLLRSIRAVVRDHDWGTAPLIVDLMRETEATLTLHVRSDGLGSSFRGVVRVEARADRLDVICDLESEGDFDTNRTGLVVLHPPRLAGAPLRATHADGETEETAFPEAISPHQPVFDIAALAWLDDGFEVSLVFDGDVFEMEDQRNWSDASFKTYSRPLGLPFPYRVAAGERVRQTISVRARRTSGTVQVPASADRIVLSGGGRFPAIAVGASTAPDPAPAAPAGAGPISNELLVELDLRSSNWRAALDRAAASALPLDVRVVLPAGDAAPILDELVALLADARVRRVAAFDPVLHVSDGATVAALRSALAAAGVHVPVIGGTRSHFTELNREHERVPREVDGIAFASTPLFHTVGAEQLIESVRMQRRIARQAVDIAEGRPVFVGPVTLRARFNNVATAPERAPTRTDLAEGYGAQLTGADDARQRSPELAAWTIASAAAFAVPGVAGIAFFEEWGQRGVRDAQGADLPVAAALRALSSLVGGALLSGDSPDGLIWAVGSRTGDSTTVLVANLGEAPRTVTVQMGAETAEVEVAARSFVTRR
ncbi:MAG: hypothetical protein ABWY37_11585 [Microbacterium pygmaeum]